MHIFEAFFHKHLIYECNIVIWILNLRKINLNPKKINTIFKLWLWSLKQNYFKIITSPDLSFVYFLLAYFPKLSKMNHFQHHFKSKHKLLSAIQFTKTWDTNPINGHRSICNIFQLYVALLVILNLFGLSHCVQIHLTFFLCHLIKSHCRKDLCIWVERIIFNSNFSRIKM